ncbi:MAG: luciferase family protein [Actinomycetota bacterium]
MRRRPDLLVPGRGPRVGTALAPLIVLGLLATCASAPTATVPTAAVVELPVRPGPRTETSYTVPHVQVFVDPVPEVDTELRRRIFLLPDVERRESITSIKGTYALWLTPEAPTPRATLREREFAHIHPDGSFHLVLPVDRALEAIETKWAEFHPWVGREDFWDGMVMLYTPQSEDEAEITLQLVIDSYNFVTGRDVTTESLE